jgi:hypothetical protein
LIAALILGLGLVFGAVAHGFCVVHHHDYFGIDRGARWWFGGGREVCGIFGCGAIGVWCLCGFREIVKIRPTTKNGRAC